jgi:primary-amine oxidase
MAEPITAPNPTTPTTTAGHPLEPLSLDELTAAVELLVGSGRLGTAPAVAWVALLEPPKQDVLAWRPGQPVARRAQVVSVDRETGITYESVVDLSEGVVERADPKPRLHAPILPIEWFEATAAVLRDQRVRAALAARGITDLDTVVVEPWPAGYFDEEVDGLGRRIGRALLFVREHDGDTPWARPIEGLLVLADRTNGDVLEVRDTVTVPVPRDPGRMGADDHEPLRDDLQPLVISQPQGPSFVLDGNELRWQRWSLRVSIHPVEGLVLHQIAYDDPAAGRVRPICYRASLSEMVVPYADPGPLYYWRHVFDGGEAALGRNSQSLTLGCDCLGEIRYLDAPIIGFDGQPTVIPNAVCVHEEDYGVLWRHADWRSEATHVRRSRRLVVSSWVNLGNYDYGFFWYLYLDGTIQVEVKLTGVVAASALPPGERSAHGALVAPNLAAPHHQHLFCFRLDLDIDGVENFVEEVDLVSDPPGPGNPGGGAFRAVATRLRREGEARRDAAPEAGRIWRVSSQARNGMDEPTAYALVPGGQPALLGSDDSVVARRAGFARHHLWVTQHADHELRAAGDYPNQHRGGDGLPSYAAGDRSLDDTDVVLWFTCGSNHVARPEDWPVMPVEYAGFHLRPIGFFDRNPALDVPPQERINPDGHCH